MTTDKDIVAQSYGKCCLSPSFFDDFYATFTASSPKIREKFVNTNMAKQKQLLREGITFMVMYYGGSATGMTKVKKLGESHSKDRMNIESPMYNLWLEALIKTIAKHDREFTPSVERAWRTVLGKGIQAMRSMYNIPQPVSV